MVGNRGHLDGDESDEFDNSTGKAHLQLPHSAH